MKPAAFHYDRPKSLSDALAKLQADGSELKVLAGGQSLGPMMNLRLARPHTLVDVSGLSELRTIELDGARAALGASITHAEIEDLASGESPENRSVASILSGVAGNIAYRAVRNRGTIGGSLAHADPAADWLTALTALNACVEVQAEGRTRSVPMASFVHGAYTTDLQPDEVIVAVRLPPLSREVRWGYEKICRKVGEFSIAIGAVVVDPPHRYAEVVAGSMGGRPIRLPAIAHELAQTAAVPALASVKAALEAAAPPVDDVKLHTVAVSVHRSISQALSA